MVRPAKCGKGQEDIEKGRFSGYDAATREPGFIVNKKEHPVRETRTMKDLQWNREFALEQAGEDEELLAELLELLISASGADLARIKQGYQEQDAGKMADAAHSIKGAAASLGIEEFRQTASALEQAGRSGDLAGAFALLPALEDIISQLADLK